LSRGLGGSRHQPRSLARSLHRGCLGKLYPSGAVVRSPPTPTDSRPPRRAECLAPAQIRLGPSARPACAGATHPAHPTPPRLAPRDTPLSHSAFTLERRANSSPRPAAPRLRRRKTAAAELANPLALPQAPLLRRIPPPRVDATHTLRSSPTISRPRARNRPRLPPRLVRTFPALTRPENSSRRGRSSQARCARYARAPYTGQ